MTITNTERLSAVDLAADALVVGHQALVVGQEQHGGAEVRSQDADDWVSLPAEMNADGANGQLGFYGARAAAECGWGRRAPGQWWPPRDVSEILLATYEELGFVVHPDDRAGLRMYWWWEDRLREMRRAFGEWVDEHEMKYSGKGGWALGARTPLADEFRRRSAVIRDAERWAEDRYMRGDRCFVRARLPEGWSFEAGENRYGYWTDVVDERGFQRCAIFYKAAFYDRSAHVLILSIPETRAQCDAYNAVVYPPEHEGLRYEDKPWTASGEDVWVDGERLLGRVQLEDWSVLYRLFRPIGHERAGRGEWRELVVAPDGTVERDEVLS